MAEKLFTLKRPANKIVEHKNPEGQLMGVEPVSAWYGYDIAVGAVCMQGPNIYAAIALRDKLKAAQAPFFQVVHDAQYILVTEQEKSFLEAALTGYDWTFKHAPKPVTFWTDWREFFLAIRDNFEAYNPEDPSADYLADRARYKEALAAIEKQQAAAEAAALAEKDAKEVEAGEGAAVEGAEAGEDETAPEAGVKTRRSRRK